MVFREGGSDGAGPMLTRLFARRRLGGLLLLGAAIAVGGSGCGSSRAGRQVPPDRACGEIHLQAVGKAIVDYRAKHGALPQVVLGPGGLKHSWRMLLAPSLIARCYHGNTIDYRFDESWDSPHNRDAVRSCSLSWMNMYTCPLESGFSGYPYVSYVMLVRPPVTDAHTGNQVKAPLPGDAVLIVESAHCGIQYAEPKDLDWDALWKGDSPFGPGKLNSLHAEVVKAVRVDGKVIDIPKTISRDALRKLLSGNARS